MPDAESRDSDRQGRLRGSVPWWARIGAKLVLSRLPVGPAGWSRVRLFVPGAMDDPDYACGVFAKHHARATPPDGFALLELGPGDSLASGLVCRAFGGRASYLVDHGPYAQDDLEGYRALARRLAERGTPVPDDVVLDSEDAMRRTCGIHYLTDGLRALREIPDASVDFVFSHAVLEHVRLGEFDATLRELHRVARPGSTASHEIDFRDHLGGGLNNLRFSTRVWESEFMARSGFYTNRLAFSDMLERMRAAGFHVEVLEVKRWDVIPIHRRQLASEFASRSDEDLCVRSASVRLACLPPAPGQP